MRLFILYFVVLGTFMFSRPAQAETSDTIDFWTVYLNGKKIESLSASGTLHLKKADLKAGDTLTVIYWRDAPCGDCPCSLTLENGKHLRFYTVEGVGSNIPLNIPVSEILLRPGIALEIHYQEEYGYRERSPQSRFLVEIQIE